MKNIFVRLIIIFSFFIGLNQAFAQAGFIFPVHSWSLPAGGRLAGNINYSFKDITSFPYLFDDNGSQSWTLTDMNGDNKPDLVVYSEKQNSAPGTYNPTNNPYWKVYLNNGISFDLTAVNWSLPPGGEFANATIFSYRYTDYNIDPADEDGSQSYTLMDMNGDSKPDLVIYAERRNGEPAVFGTAGNNFWKVYLNTGSGFSITATNYNLPQGGESYNAVNYNFRRLSYNVFFADDDGSQSWALQDMNADKMPDLVICAEKQGGNILTYSQTSASHWKVFLNNGIGFSAVATDFALPAGGEVYNGINYSFRNLNYSINVADDNNSQSWLLTDMNADHLPDLVVYAEKQIAAINTFNLAGSSYWKVYLNTGAGFSSTAITWLLPAGGEKYNGIDYSFCGINYEAALSDDDGSNSWAVMDLNADAAPDLIVYAEKQNGQSKVYNDTSGSYWKTFLNTGLGFSSSAVMWKVPAGGEKYNAVDYSFRHLFYTTGSVDDDGSQSWALIDMDADSKPEIVICAEKQNSMVTAYDPLNNPYWKTYSSNIIVGLNESTTNKSMFSLFPNPSKDKFYIISDVKDFDITLYDNRGNCVYEMRTVNSKQEIDLSEKPSGLYYLRINDSGSISTAKIIKQ